ncbi:MAG: hypothetical protein WBV82_10785 [Myxococcaceae bacterium]
MGGFATSVHVMPAEAADPKAIIRTVTSALETAMASEGFRPAVSGETPDRGIVVMQTSRAPRWVAIFDQHAESQDDTNEALARALSASLNAPAVTMLVHDGDLGEIQLFTSGQLRDKFSTSPDYFRPVTAAEMRAWRGDPSKWSTEGSLPIE